MLISANITKQSLVNDEKLKVILEFTPQTKSEQTNLSEAICNIHIIQFDKNIFINPVFSCTKNIDMRAKKIDINIDVSSLSPGVYCFYYLLINIADQNDSEGLTYKAEYPDLVFEIRENKSGYQKCHYEMIEERDYILNEYTTMFNMGIGVEKSSITKEYECYLFCSDIYIGKRMQLGKCIVFPYKSIDNRNIYDYLNNFVQSIGVGPLPDRPQKIEDYNPYSQPVTVIYYPVVIAHSPEEAGNIAHEKAKMIINAFSVTNDSYGTIVGDVLIDKKNNLKYHRCKYSSYMGNLFVGMENPKRLFSLAECSELDPLKKFYLELFIDCSREKRGKYAYFHFWNLLETIGRNKNFVGKPKVDINGNAVLNRRSLPIMIQDNAYEIVFELIRQSYQEVGKLPLSNPTNLLQSNIEDRITIWYQRRNCIAHRGGCFYSDTSICDQTNNKKYKCYLAYDEMRNKAQSKDNIVDEYLFDLKNISREILLIQLNC